MAKSALILFSGGQDSAVCLADALERYARVETVGFAYGQRHVIELETRQRYLENMRALFPAWGAKLGDDHVLELPTLGRISETSLTRETAIHIGAAGLPNTFVPGRKCCFSPMRQRWRGGAASPRSLAACARPIIPAIPIAAMTRCKP